MLNRFATLAAVCMLVPVGTAPLAAADPDPNAPAVPVADAGPPPGGPAGPVPSAPPGVLKTPDGWTLTVAGSNESMESVAPLTGSPASREYLVDGKFTGSVTGGGSTKLAGGTLEAGYQIGCGILADDIESITSAGITPGIGIPLVSGSIFPLTLGASVSEQLKIDLKPGTVSIVPIDKKSFKGASPRINVTGLRVKFDLCAGQSFIRSYATLTSSTDNTDDVVNYIGVTKVV
ncbi:MAG: MspA protein [Mycobacterium sp.]|nr:MspA protein [Mycobacterium sp.]